MHPVTTALVRWMVMRGEESKVGLAVGIICATWNSVVCSLSRVRMAPSLASASSPIYTLPIHMPGLDFWHVCCAAPN